MPDLSQHEPAFVALFADVLTAARMGTRSFVGSPGSITTRFKSGAGYYYRQYYRADGRRADEYIGPVDSADGEAGRTTIELEIETARRLGRNARSLVREGFAAVDSRTAATLAALADHGLFQAGLVLVGTHAYGALVNALGVRASHVQTEDIDVARLSRLDLAAPLNRSWPELLGDSGLMYVPVPGFRRGEPSTSFKMPGADRLRVDLLAPAAGDEVGIVEIPELSTHAQTLPYLAFLLGETQHSVVLGPGKAIPVRVPVAERFAVHKLLVSQLRRGRDAKADKDLAQAAVLLKCMAGRDADAVYDALNALPVSALGKVRAAAAGAGIVLE